MSYQLHIESKIWHKQTYPRNRKTQIWRTGLGFPRGWGGMNWEAGVTRCKLSYTECINNKILLYSAGSHIQYPVTNPNGKEYKNECMCSVAQSCPTLWDTMDCSPPGSSLHGDSAGKNTRVERAYIYI